MGHKDEKEFTIDNVHLVIGQSQSININMDTLVEPGIQVIYYKHEQGANFLIAIEESTLEIIVKSSAERKMLKNKSEGKDRIVIAFIEQSTENLKDYNVYPVMDCRDELFFSWLEKFGDRFFRLIDNFSKWPSFTEFLEVDCLYDVNTTHPFKQVPLDYHFLIGSLEDSGNIHHAGHLPSDRGIYIIPDYNVIPVFTSAIYADIYAQLVKKQSGIELQADWLPCVKCYLSGSYKSIKSIRPNGAILNNQWLFDCFNCNMHDNFSGHFYLNDGGNTYALYGCPELDFKPIWIEKRWDENKKYFNPLCGMRKW